MSNESINPRPASPYYEDPENPALPNSGLKLDLSRAALVVIDLWIDHHQGSTGQI